jgi:hypothetical protein
MPWIASAGQFIEQLAFGSGQVRRGSLSWWKAGLADWDYVVEVRLTGHWSKSSKENIDW